MVNPKDMKKTGLRGQVVLDMDSLALNATLPASNNSSEFDCFDEFRILWAVSCIPVFLLGFPLSIWVLWDLVDKHYRGGQPWTPNAVFILNVTLMDFAFLAFLPLDALNLLFIDNKILMDFISVILGLSSSGRPLLMACMCLDCYMAVHHPLRYRSQTLSSRVIITAVIWLTSLVNGAAFMIDPHLMYEPGMWWPFLFSAVVIVYCDCCILWTLSRSKTSRGEPHQLKKRALDIISMSLFVTVVNYLPTIIIVLFGDSFSLGSNTCLNQFLTQISLEFTSIFMPALYLRKVGKLNFAKIFKPSSKAMELTTARV